MSLVESFANSLGASFIIYTLRLIGHKFKYIQIFMTLVYLDNKL